MRTDFAKHFDRYSVPMIYRLITDDGLLWMDRSISSGTACVIKLLMRCNLRESKSKGLRRLHVEMRMRLIIEGGQLVIINKNCWWSFVFLVVLGYLLM